MITQEEIDKLKQQLADPTWDTVQQLFAAIPVLVAEVERLRLAIIDHEKAVADWRQALPRFPDSLNPGWYNGESMTCKSCGWMQYRRLSTNVEHLTCEYCKSTDFEHKGYVIV